MRTEQFPALAAELAKARLDAVFCGGAVAARALQEVSRTIPILTLTDDMVGQGLAQSLARPGGNITGMSILARELDGKRQEILLELVPSARRIAALVNSNITTAQDVKILQDAARARAASNSWPIPWSGRSGSVRPLTKPSARAPKLSTCWPRRSSTIGAATIDERVTTSRLPTIFQWPENPEEGGLIGYGPRSTELRRQFVRRLRQGAARSQAERPAGAAADQVRAGDQPQDRQGARLDVPAWLALRADEVIE